MKNLPIIKEIDNDYLKLTFPAGQTLYVSREKPCLEAWLASAQVDRTESFPQFLANAGIARILGLPYVIAAANSFGDKDSEDGELTLIERLEPLHRKKIARGFYSPFHGMYDEPDHAAIVVVSEDFMFKHNLQAIYEAIARNTVLDQDGQQYVVDFTDAARAIADFRNEQVILPPRNFAYGRIENGKEYKLYNPVLPEFITP